MFGMGKKIDVKAIREELDSNDAFLIDVRENDEWDREHAKDALHLSVNRIMNGELPSQDTSKKLYVYCASGGRSGMAAQFLKAKGFSVENLGGLRDWKAAGGPTEAGM